MQVISSLLNMQARLVSDPRARDAYADSIRRVRSMAMAHEKLYRSENLSEVDFGEYLRSVASELNSSIGRESIALTVNAERIMLGIDTAVPCGLIANELISNALKHAFTGRDEGHITVDFRRLPAGELRLCVQDNGKGLPEGVDLRTLPSLGLSIVSSLTDQLGGALAITRERGTSVTVTFPG
jgi:two-component sensor histidine kinase